MQCLNPLHIRNKYTGVFMYVPCGKCVACQTFSAVSKSASLATDFNNYERVLFVTLTYDNQHVPYIINGGNVIYRNGEVVEVMDKSFKVSSFVPVRGFGNPDAIGVIYYRDFQLFFKRLRKKLYEEFGKYDLYRYFICLEYGTFYHRPHGHVLIQFASRRVAEYTARVLPECWKMCDWSNLTDAIKFASSGISSYVSSYVNCVSCSCEISRYKEFKQTRKRSKNVAFGLDFDLSKKVKTIVEKYYGKEFPDFVESDFRFCKTSQVGIVSDCLISQSYFNPYFRQPKGFSSLSFQHFRLLCFALYSMYVFKSRYGTGKFPKAGISFDTEESNKVVIRAYLRFIVEFGYVDSFDTFDKYVTFSYRLLAYYKALLVKDSMRMYESLGAEQYLKYCYNTFTKRVNRYKRYVILSSLGLSYNLVSDGKFYIDAEQTKINQNVMRYKNFLLPKHFNSLIQKV